MDQWGRNARSPDLRLSCSKSTRLFFSSDPCKCCRYLDIRFTRCFCNPLPKVQETHDKDAAARCDQQRDTFAAWWVEKMSQGLRRIPCWPPGISWIFDPHQETSEDTLTTGGGHGCLFQGGSPRGVLGSWSAPAECELTQQRVTLPLWHRDTSLPPTLWHRDTNFPSA